MNHTVARLVLFARTAGFLALAGSGGAAVAADQPAAAASPGQTSAETERAVHVLNRLGYGPRAGDVERVCREGIDAYLRKQLDPSSIADSAVDAALAPLDTLRQDNQHFLDKYYEDIKYFLQKQAQAGNAAEMKMRYGLTLADHPAASDAPAKPDVPNLDEIAHFDAVRCIAEQQQARLIRASMSNRQLQEVLVDFWFNHFNVDVRKESCRAFAVSYERDVIRPHVLGTFRDLLGAVAHSPAMLVYLDNNKNSVAREIGGLERTIAAAYVNYKFGMNVSNMLPRREGPNENYARELLELHTLGVDGGYTQQDVQEVGRCFSGWSLSPFSGKFEFKKNRHDPAAKTVLGHAVAAGGGVRDGEQVLDWLAVHPSTARFISRKLCQRFVSDDPPSALVDHVTAVFVQSGGDLRQVVEAVVTSDAFFAPEARRAKIKSPLEYAASAVRATNAQFTGRGWGVFGRLSYVGEGGALLGNQTSLSNAKTKTLNWHVHDMGEPLLACMAPTGYSEVSTGWVSPSALLDRMNFAQALTESTVKDVKVRAEELLARTVDRTDAAAVTDAVAQALLHAPLTDASQKTILQTVRPKAGKPVDVSRVAGLILGSPEFQRR